MPINQFGQEIGPDLEAWSPPPPPPYSVIRGRTVRLEPLDPARHVPQLAGALVGSDAAMWTYTPYGPFTDTDDVVRAVTGMLEPDDWQAYAVVRDEDAVGFACYLRIKPGAGTIEVGSIGFSPSLQRTTAATETLYLLIRNAFDLGYRRCEWKCDAFNRTSRSAAERLNIRGRKIVAIGRVREYECILIKRNELRYALCSTNAINTAR